MANIKAGNLKTVKLGIIKPNPANNNKHTPEQIDALAKIINFQGQRLPITISKLSGLIVKGHATLKAIKKLGWKEALVDYQDFTDEAQEYAHMTADNEIARWSAFDMKAFDISSKKLFGKGFDFDILGIQGMASKKEEDKKVEIEDVIPEKVKAIAKLGQIYQLGNHRLMCGDSTSIDAVEKLMNGEKADMVHTDPPYNVDYSNQDRPKAGKIDHGKIANDKMDDGEFHSLLSAAFSNAHLVSKDGSSLYTWYASVETVSFFEAVKNSGWAINQQVIWKKPMLLGRGKYQWAHEPCIFAIKGSPYFTGDRTKTTVWDFGGYDKSNNVHPTQKPVVVPTEAIENSSMQNETVLDLFGGSGSTLIACEKTNRKCFMMELDPHYVDVIIARWESYAGKKAKLISKQKK